MKIIRNITLLLIGIAINAPLLNAGKSTKKRDRSPAPIAPVEDVSAQTLSEVRRDVDHFGRATSEELADTGRHVARRMETRQNLVTKITQLATLLNLEAKDFSTESVEAAKAMITDALTMVDRYRNHKILDQKTYLELTKKLQSLELLLNKLIITGASVFVANIADQLAATTESSPVLKQSAEIKDQLIAAIKTNTATLHTVTTGAFVATSTDLVMQETQPTAMNNTVFNWIVRVLSKNENYAGTIRELEAQGLIRTVANCSLDQLDSIKNYALAAIAVHADKKALKLLVQILPTYTMLGLPLVTELSVGSATMLLSMVLYKATVGAVMDGSAKAMAEHLVRSLSHPETLYQNIKGHLLQLNAFDSSVMLGKMMSSIIQSVLGYMLIEAVPQLRYPLAAYVAGKKAIQGTRSAARGASNVWRKLRRY